MLKSFDECADRIEAATLGLRPETLSAIAGQIRNGEIPILSLSHLRREAERLLEGIKSIDRLIATEQARA